MPLDDIERLILAMVKQCASPAEYQSEGEDIIIVFHDTVPVVVVPSSDRAKALFIRWGMEESCLGINPPDKPEDLMESIPNNWTVRMSTPEEGVHKLTQITLPQPLVVVH